ncbi:hypothetical protein L596_018404 [Steinernema carpocapsae]|uniref:Cytochrome b5 heme-binding domain-containing protein n=1 Tax=Steinernema carpocapsae TaxID=34508 RepID=A0A4U5N4K5_STECR|nr:hypothetical protein L596_018404 [Steinernema carpocapsae]
MLQTLFTAPSHRNPDLTAQGTGNRSPRDLWKSPNISAFAVYLSPSAPPASPPTEMTPRLFLPKPPLLVKPLIACASLIAISAFLAAHYELESPVLPALSWAWNKLNEFDVIRDNVEALKTYVGVDEESQMYAKERASGGRHPGSDVNVDFRATGLPMFTREQLQLFDGTRPSKPVYLALLGRVYDVEKGRKHYGKGGGYHFFAGKDATRAFVSGDFTDEGLVDDVEGLSEQDLLGIHDWVTFYERDYKLVGILQGTYYDANGKMTQRLKEVKQLIDKAKEWRNSQAKESEVFPPCNSEWHKDSGGRVWCTTKSGGIHREWVGVPRKLFNSATKSHRCACVKNFGPPLATHDEHGKRGDLDHPNLQEYDECSPTSMSCKLPSRDDA